MSTSTNTQFLLALTDPQNTGAWTEFCTRYSPILLAFGRRLGLNEQDAQDSAQDCLLAFMKGLRAGKYDRRKGRLRTWLYGIASHKIRDLQRSRMQEKRVPSSPQDTDILEQVPDDHGTSEIWEAEWQRAVLTACVRQLAREVKPLTMRIFHLCVVENKSNGEVASLLNMPKDSVAKAKSRILARLREVRTSLEGEL